MIMYLLNLRKILNIKINLMVSYLEKVNRKDNFYLEVNNKRYLILINNMNSTYINDYVTVECFNKNGKDIAIVKDIIQRKTATHVFTYKNIGGTYKMIP